MTGPMCMLVNHLTIDAGQRMVHDLRIALWARGDLTARRRRRGQRAG